MRKLFWNWLIRTWNIKQHGRVLNGTVASRRLCDGPVLHPRCPSMCLNKDLENLYTKQTKAWRLKLDCSTKNKVLNWWQKVMIWSPIHYSIIWFKDFTIYRRIAKASIGLQHQQFWNIVSKKLQLINSATLIIHHSQYMIKSELKSNLLQFLLAVTLP